MSAAIEGAIEGIPSIGFSLCDFSSDANFSHVRPYVQQIASNVLANGLPKGVALNVNFPKKSEQTLKGVRICRQTNGKWQEELTKEKTHMAVAIFGYQAIS